MIDYMDNKTILSGCFIIKDFSILLLYRKDHRWYETPGGKVDSADCIDPNHITEDDLRKTTERELHEELGAGIKFSELKYFGKVETRIPDGRVIIANKFITHVLSGNPKINEPEIFSKAEYISIKDLETYPISPDFKSFLPKLQEYFRNKKHP
jgi:8-oxo-dGTP pyrophosphatase MutT (NUDIX family)